MSRGRCELDRGRNFLHVMCRVCEFNSLKSKMCSYFGKKGVI